MSAKVSIIIPCYNQAEYLDEALQSVLSQTYSNWECIIVNDGSTDGTEIIAGNWCNNDKRFSYYYKENGGVATARNLGLQKVTGTFIQFLDSDDFLDNRKLELSIKVLENSNSKLVITNFRMFEGSPGNSFDPFCELKGELLNFRNILFECMKGFNIPIHCGLFHSDLFKGFKFPEDLKAIDDWILWLYVLQEEIKPVFLDKPLALYRIHPKSMTQNKKLIQGNYFKALVYLPKIIPSEVALEYYLMELKQKNKQIDQLQNNILNYKKTMTYRVSQTIKIFFNLK